MCNFEHTSPWGAGKISFDNFCLSPRQSSLVGPIGKREREHQWNASEAASNGSITQKGTAFWDATAVRMYSSTLAPSLVRATKACKRATKLNSRSFRDRNGRRQPTSLRSLLIPSQQARDLETRILRPEATVGRKWQRSFS